MTSATRFREEVTSGQRFEFGKNWRRFLAVLDDERIMEAERSLKSMLGVETLATKTFLDVGSGSGLFSLAAMRLGAERVHSFDYDDQSLACTREVKRRYLPDAVNWTVEQGSVLDSAYLERLGQWDIVYSWGVLHHTGDMWQALENLVPLVRKEGALFVSIYNDQGTSSARWRAIKALYNKGRAGAGLVLAIFIPYFVVRGVGADLLRRKNPLDRYRTYKRNRGMSLIHDVIDWLGGYPFEVAMPEEIFQFYRARGFSLDALKTCRGGFGCNEFAFRRQ